MLRRKSFLVLLVFLLPLVASAQTQRRQKAVQPQEEPQWSWDIGLAAGSYDSYSYTEIDLGLNDRFMSPFNWRNVLWDRFGNTTIDAAGLDSSIRYEFSDASPGSRAGFRFFIGPGVRVSSPQYSGGFGELGLIFRLGGLNLGAGIKDLYYWSPGKDPNTGAPMPTSDLMYFIILSGGGTL